MTDRLALLREQLAARGVSADEVARLLREQRLQTPSWGYSNSGTRFGVFRQPGAARDVHERLADAALVHELTGICPTVAIHVPWDRVDNYSALAQEARDLGIRIGSVNPNLFQDPAYELGSFGHPDAAVRRRAVDHVLECIEIMQQVGCGVLSLWFADGTNYPGQDDFRRRKHAFHECLGAVHARLPAEATMLLEYKPFEPAFYHSDVADWGMAYVFANYLQPNTKVLVDLGHHLHGANIEHIVAFLLDEGLIGGFHFNNRKYADDDLTTGSTNPYEVFLIYHEIAAVKAFGLDFMIDQSHTIKPKIEAMLQTVMFLQETFAQALCVDRRALAEAQAAGDAVLAERCLKDAFTTDVRPLVEQVRVEMGCPPDPLLAYRTSGGAAERIAARCAPKTGASGWA